METPQESGGMSLVEKRGDTLRNGRRPNHAVHVAAVKQAQLSSTTTTTTATITPTTTTTAASPSRLPKSAPHSPSSSMASTCADAASLLSPVSATCTESPSSAGAQAMETLECERNITSTVSLLMKGSGEQKVKMRKKKKKKIVQLNSDKLKVLEVRRGEIGSDESSDETEEVHSPGACGEGVREAASKKKEKGKSVLDYVNCEDRTDSGIARTETTSGEGIAEARRFDHHEDRREVKGLIEKKGRDSPTAADRIASYREGRERENTEDKNTKTCIPSSPFSPSSSNQSPSQLSPLSSSSTSSEKEDGDAQEDSNKSTKGRKTKKKAERQHSDLEEDSFEQSEIEWDRDMPQPEEKEKRKKRKREGKKRKRKTDSSDDGRFDNSDDKKRRKRDQWSGVRGLPS